MTKINLFGAAIILSAAVATPALAQAVIQEPGAYAFYHPDGELNLGPSRPADAMARFGTVTMSHPVRLKRLQSSTHH